ncbi:MAG: UDP-glucose 4-epimerase GalE, partial [Candidatus Nanopelagicales bacterium]|nr:UDP-glucose 4-epimerase GalE [Candidatus Nanopelagicales bacterium]
MTTWLLSGGAGYIGAHVLRSLQASGRDVVVLDDLSTGLARKVPDGVPLIQANVADRAQVAAALRDHDVTGVVHLAAKKAVGESVERPEYYYRENVDGMLSLLEAMQEVGTRAFVYSSSAAVYGTPAQEFVTEDAPLAPESPYGQTKVVGEWMTRNAAVNHEFSWTSLRYFNVAGAASPDLGDTSVFNLIPMVFRALSQGQRPQVFGDDYPTRDGSCIRDYIHVADLAEAHVVAAAACEDHTVGEVYNVGRGEGVSVLEVVQMVSEVVGYDVHAEVAPRRPGDPAQLVATV